MEAKRKIISENNSMFRSNKHACVIYENETITWTTSPSRCSFRSTINSLDCSISFLYFSKRFWNTTRLATPVSSSTVIKQIPPAVPGLCLPIQGQQLSPGLQYNTAAEAAFKVGVAFIKKEAKI